MAVYDENILKNSFYLALERQRPDLCKKVAELHGIVLVPCCGSLTVNSYPDSLFDSYVLQPGEDGYRTLDGKEVRIQDRQVMLGTGFPAPASVPILFEETFYNEQEQSFSILCISRPVEVESSPAEVSQLPAYCLKSMEDVREFLGYHAHKLDKFIQGFGQAFREQERKGLRHLIDSVSSLYTKCIQCLLRDSRLMVLAKQKLQMTLLKQAVEMYVHDGIYHFIFNFVGTLEASQDAAFNKTTRSLQELQLKHLGVKPEFSINLSRAKRELSRLNQQTSPLLKLMCLRRVALTATHTNTRSVSIEAVSADDLLSTVLYLLVKSEIPNWMANLSYIRNFCFSHSSKDELSYCLSTFEAAVEYINLGKLQDMHSGLGELNGKMLFQERMSLLSAATPIQSLFEHIANGNEAEVERLLSVEEAEEDIRMCHPLCSCDLCDLQQSGHLNDPSIITPMSRDDRGYTPLHVAAVCGQAQLIDVLVRKGAPVNATDYHTLTPLHLACQRGYQGVTLLLLHYKAFPDAQDNNGNTPLHLSCMYGHEDCVKALVYFDLKTCSLDLQNDKGDTALHMAARWGYEGILEVLLENGANSRVLNKSKESPLQCALNSKILMLLQSTQYSRQSTSRVYSPCPSPLASDCSSRRSSVSSTSSLGSEVKVEAEPVRHRKVEKLLRAVADGDVEMVRYLLEWMEEEEEDGVFRSVAELCHPLCLCPQCSPAQKMSVLEAGALGVDSSNVDGFTSLHVAALHGRSALVALLIRHGANVNARTNQSATPLHLASQNSHVQVVRFLLECNAKLNKKDHYGNTPLIHACLRGNVETASILLQSNALVNVANLQGNTALHEAVRGGHQDLVELLLRGGASPGLRNRRQRTPLDCAYELGGKNTETLRILQKASGLSPDEEPIKLLSVPKGTLAHSFVQRLRLQDPSNGRRQRLAQSISRVQQMKKGSSGSPPRCSPPLRQGNAEWRMLKRGETLEVSNPSAGLDGGRHHRERPLRHCHTLEDPEYTTDHQTHPEHTRDHQTHPEHTRDPQTHPEHTRDHQTHPEHTRDPQTHPEHTRDPQTHPEHTRDPQTHPEHTIDPQTHPEHTADRQTHPEHTIDPQTHPEHTIDPQTHPEHTADSQTHPEHTIDPQTHPEHTIDHQTHPEHTIDPQTHPEHTIDHQTHPEHTIDPQTHPEHTIDPQTHPEHTIDPQTHPEHTIDPQTHPEHTADSQTHPEHTIDPQTHPEHTIDHQTHPEHTIDPQTHPEHTIDPQTHPEHTIDPQTHPEHTADSQTHPEHKTDNKTHLEHTTDNKTHPEHTTESQTHPDHTTDSQTHIEHVTIDQTHIEHTTDNQKHIEHITQNQTHPEHNTDSHTHTEHSQTHPEHTTDSQTHPEHTTDSQTHPEHTTDSQTHPEHLTEEQTHGHPTDHQTHPENTADSQTHPEHTTDSQTHPEHTTDSQTHPEHTTDSQTHPEHMTDNQTHIEPATENQKHIEHITQNQTHPEHTTDNQTHPENITNDQTHTEHTADNHTHPQHIRDPQTHTEHTTDNHTHTEHITNESHPFDLSGVEEVSEIN